VRHAQSLVDPTCNPREWGLTDLGAAAARRLVSLALFDHAAGYHAGAEPKMLETLAAVAADRGHDVQTEPAFGETRSEGWLGADEFQATVHRFFESPSQAPAPGWEPAEAAVARFAAGVERLRAHYAPVVHPGRALPGTFAIASGGRMLTAYLADVLGLAPDAAMERWSRLRMPDVAVLELAPATPARLVIPFGTLTV
jgi:broad specificity phosphatase PhoE